MYKKFLEKHQTLATQFDLVSRVGWVVVVGRGAFRKVDPD